jgi:hypothetical protein
MALQTAQASYAAQALLALLLAVAVVGVLWSTWRALLVDVDWQDCFRRYPLPAPRRLPGLPYTTPWSPLGRFFARTGQFRRWSEHAPVHVRSAWYSLLVLPALILVLSAIAGWPLLVLSLAALALSLIEWRVARRSLHRSARPDRAHLSLQAAVQVGLGWLAGHTTLASPTWDAVTLACCYAIAFQGALVLTQPARSPEQRNRALLFSYLGQAAALGLLVVLGRSLSAALAALLLAPQWLLLARLGEEGVPNHAPNAPPTAHPSSQKWYLQRALPFCMLAMLFAAWAPL